MGESRLPTVLKLEGSALPSFPTREARVSRTCSRQPRWKRSQDRLEPDIAVVENYGFNARELNRLVRIVRKERERFLRAWHEHFR